MCSLAQWQTGCRATASCSWGYAPRGWSCTSSYTASKFCNLAPSYDFNPAVAGDQDGLLVTASSGLKSCAADFSGLNGLVAPPTSIFDVTGNLKELTGVGANQYTVMGGAFDTASEGGAPWSHGAPAQRPTACKSTGSRRRC